MKLYGYSTEGPIKKEAKLMAKPEEEKSVKRVISTARINDSAKKDSRMNEMLEKRKAAAEKANQYIRPPQSARKSGPAASPGLKP